MACSFCVLSLVGKNEATTHMSVEYAGQREQFGVAIGSFQAVKHRCADMETRRLSHWQQWPVQSQRGLSLACPSNCFQGAGL